jgi:peptidoglycan/LPS O-acetylase OafA/YrhL
VALWLVPMVGLSLFAWFRCDRARPILTALTAMVVALSVWYVFDSHAWRTFENAHGPVRGIAIFALSAAIAVFGYRRPRWGGILLLVACVIPVLLSALASGGFGMSSLGALTAPAIITGALYLWSSGIEESARTSGPSTFGPRARRPSRSR